MALRERILIIGNGFDLYHELPTKYSQFIKVLMNIENLNLDDDKDISFEDLFLDVERYSEMKIRFNTEMMVFDKDKILEIKNQLQNNSWYKSFKTKLNFKNWIDIEDEIKKTLKVFVKIINDVHRLIDSNKSIKKIFVKNSDENKNDTIIINNEDFQYLNAFGLLDEKERLMLKKIKFNSIAGNLISFNSEQFYEDLFKELQIFTNLFNTYLVSIVSTFYERIDFEYASKLENLKHDISSFYTFNYTPTLEKLYRVDKEKINYLHGRYSSENHTIVLGIEEVDDELHNDKIFMFTKYYQKLFNDTDYKFLSEIKSTSKYDSLDKDFILFGHSLADNDENYIKELFNVAKQREKNTITILFYSLNDKAQKLKNLLKIIGRKDVEFLMKLKRLIFIEINDKPFETVFNLLPISDFDSFRDPLFIDI